MFLRMTYITYRRFRGRAICGDVNIPYGTKLDEQDGMLYLKGLPVCLITSENGWEHFRPDTREATIRQERLEALYEYYAGHRDTFYEDMPEIGMRPEENSYWKNRLRTAPDNTLILLMLKRGLKT